MKLVSETLRAANWHGFEPTNYFNALLSIHPFCIFVIFEWFIDFVIPLLYKNGLLIIFDLSLFRTIVPNTDKSNFFIHAYVRNPSIFLFSKKFTPSEGVNNADNSYI